VRCPAARNTAPRSCVCGHPVYDQEPRCPLCACPEHKPRLPAAGGHGAPAAVLPGTGEAGRRPAPELPGPFWCWPCAAACRCPEPVPANAPRQRPPAARCQRRPAVGRPGRTQPPCGRDRTPVTESPVPGIRPGCGRPRPSLPGTPTRGGRCRRPRRAPPRPGARTGGSAQRINASNAGGSRDRQPHPHCRCPAHPWRAADALGVPAPPTSPL